MSDSKLVLLEKVAGSAQAETMRGLLEAQGVDVLLSQESAGSSTLPVTFGILGEVEILVRKEDEEKARQILDEYYAGEFEEELDESEETEKKSE